MSHASNTLPPSQFSCFSNLDDLYWFRTHFRVVPHTSLDASAIKEQVTEKTTRFIHKTFVLYYHYTSIKPSTSTRSFEKITEFDSFVHFPDGIVLGKLLHQLSKRVYYTLRISARVNSSSDNVSVQVNSVDGELTATEYPWIYLV